VTATLIDPNRTWTAVEARLAGEADPRRRRNLELVLAHMKAEARADIDAVLATLCDAPRYRTHAQPDVEALNPSGSKEAVRAFYQRTIVDSGAHRLEFAVDRVLVDDDAVLTEGTMRMAYPGRTLRAAGVDVPDPDQHYLYEARMAVVWPVDPASGLLVGEEAYTGTDGFAGIADRPIGLDQIAPLAAP
jgi:hypothetical protein